ncbi:MAG: tRNA-intron lyase [Nitrososphaerota archaeon]
MSKVVMRAEFVEGNIVVFNKEDARRLYALGYYGKPLGISKPKELNFDEPLVLDLIEALYLHDEGELTVYKNNKALSREELENLGKEYYSRFSELYIVYKDLRKRGFIVTPGIKFGSDFAVYKHGPGIDHAPFIVQVKTINDYIHATELVRAGRLATTVRKNFIIAIPDLMAEKVRYLVFSWVKF